MMNGLKIRKAVLEDMEQLLLFEQGVIASERPFDSTLKPEPIQYYDIEKMIAEDHIELLVAELNNELIGSGYARIENARPYLQHHQHAYLGFMFVKPQFRGKGVNQQIIKALSNWAASRRVTELRLDVYFPNEAAIKSYEKSGFSKHMIEMRKG